MENPVSAHRKHLLLLLLLCSKIITILHETHKSTVWYIVES